MSIRYFAWKNGRKAETEKQQWEELTAKEYKAIYESNKEKEISERRFFIRVPGVEDGDDIFMFESNYDEFREYRNEKERTSRKKKKLQEYEDEYGKFAVQSLDTEFEDGSGNSFALHNLISDDSSLFEDQLILSITMKEAMGFLTPDEFALIYSTVMSDKPMTLREYSDKIGVPFTTLEYRRKKTLEKLKSFFVQK